MKGESKKEKLKIKKEGKSKEIVKVKIEGEREQRDIRERTFQFSLHIVRLFQDLDKQSKSCA